MSTFDGHHIVIHAETGEPARTTITVDGHPLKACRRLELRMEAGHELPVVVFELYPGTLDIDLPDAVLAALKATREDMAREDESLSRESEQFSTVNARLRRLAARVDAEDAEHAEDAGHPEPAHEGEARHESLARRGDGGRS